jgi:predicted transcriptional regulator
MGNNLKSDLELELELELNTRRRVYEFIKEYPGTHLREIQRRLDMPIGLLNFHIQYLIKHEMITEKVDRYYKRYYLTGILGSVDREALTVLRQKFPRWIILYLLEHSIAKHKELLTKFNLKPSTLSFYLNGLIEKGIVNRKRAGRESSYILTKPDNIIQLLITYQPSFIDKLVDRFLETWFDGFKDMGDEEEKEGVEESEGSENNENEKNDR